MTTLIPLTLNNSASPPFQTTVTLDNVSYALSITWNLSAQRWYVALLDQFTNQIWLGPLIGSPLTYDIPLAPGIFTTSTILFREDSGNLEVSP
jgi:hypothetical protein